MLLDFGSIDINDLKKKELLYNLLVYLRLPEKEWNGFVYSQLSSLKKAENEEEMDKLILDYIYGEYNDNYILLDIKTRSVIRDKEEIVKILQKYSEENYKISKVRNFGDLSNEIDRLRALRNTRNEIKAQVRLNTIKLRNYKNQIVEI